MGYGTFWWPTEDGKQCANVFATHSWILSPPPTQSSLYCIITFSVNYPIIISFNSHSFDCQISSFHCLSPLYATHLQVLLSFQLLLLLLFGCSSAAFSPAEQITRRVMNKFFFLLASQDSDLLAATCCCFLTQRNVEHCVAFYSHSDG